MKPTLWLVQKMVALTISKVFLYSEKISSFLTRFLGNRSGMPSEAPTTPWTDLWGRDQILLLKP